MRRGPARLHEQMIAAGAIGVEQLPPCRADRDDGDDNSEGVIPPAPQADQQGESQQDLGRAKNENRAARQRHAVKMLGDLDRRLRGDDFLQAPLQ